jgi:hypothetical protein
MLDQIFDVLALMWRVLKADLPDCETLDELHDRVRVVLS